MHPQLEIGTLTTLSIAGALIAIVFSLSKPLLFFGLPTFVYTLFWVSSYLFAFLKLFRLLFTTMTHKLMEKIPLNELKVQLLTFQMEI